MKLCGLQHINKLDTLEEAVNWLCDCPIHFGITRLNEADNLEILQAAYDYEAKNRDNRFFLKTIMSKIRKLERERN